MYETIIKTIKEDEIYCKISFKFYNKILERKQIGYQEFVAGNEKDLKQQIKDFLSMKREDWYII